jgi:hypothetical protein
VKRVRAKDRRFVAEPWREPFHLDEGSPDARTPIRVSIGRVGYGFNGRPAAVRMVAPSACAA